MHFHSRFENDENATAPAQRVLITHNVDSDLDLRTFKLGSFGFGNFTKELDYTRAIYQDTIDFREQLGYVLNVRSGIDIVNEQAVWIMETIDPSTG